MNIQITKDGISLSPDNQAEVCQLRDVIKSSRDKFKMRFPDESCNRVFFFLQPMEEEATTRNCS